MKFLLLSLLVFFVSCSSSEKDEMMGEEDVEGLEQDALLDEEYEEESDEVISEEEGMDEGMDMEKSIASTDDSSDSMMAQETLDGETQVYTVKDGDTLMWIAFKLYGDYTKWKRFLSLNPQLHGNHSISGGQTIKYHPPATPFRWQPDGLPHLIKNGETLGTISQDKYGTVRRWRQLYNHNKPMIQDPNLIFAGFTLYYVPDRNISSD